MVERQLRARGLTDERVLGAMGEVPRHEFVWPDTAGEAYEDRALPIGQGQTISQPYMVALMLALLEVGPGHRVLEVGAGSGYVAALLGQLGGEVHAVELVPELARLASEVVRRLGYGNVHIVAGDGTLGLEEQAPFDRVLISAAAPGLPEPLVAQLAEGGRVVAPVGNRFMQTCQVAVKRGEKLLVEQSIDCVFVPLLGEHGWKQG